MADALIPIGKVVSIIAAKRILRVKPGKKQRPYFDELTWLWVEQYATPPVRCKVLSVKPAGDAYLVELGAGVPRDTVNFMEDATVSIAKSEQKRRAKDAFHISETIGMMVENSRGEQVGKIVETYSAPANDVVEVELPDGSLVMAPAVPEVIERVDFDRNVVIIDELERFIVTDED